MKTTLSIPAMSFAYSLDSPTTSETHFTANRQASGDIARPEDDTTTLAESFCRNFSCCGLELKSFHDLLDHYETAHKNLNAPVSSDDEDQGDDFYSRKEVNNKRKCDLESYALKNGAELYPTFDTFSYQDKRLKTPFHFQAVYYSNFVQEAATVPTTPSTPVLSNAFQRREEDAVGVSPASLNSSSEDEIAAVYADITSYDRAPEIRPILNLTQIPQQPALTLPSLVQQDSEYNSLDESYTAQGKKFHRCPIQGCTKIYKNSNGLKYHIQHCHSEEEKDMVERFQQAQYNDPVTRPYRCEVPGCNKRYKNANGLKYHMLHHH